MQVLDSANEYLPAVQYVQVLDANAEYVPASHSMQVLDEGAPGVRENLPGLQPKQFSK
jgi:hypothetical protein